MIFHRFFNLNRIFDFVEENPYAIYFRRRIHAPELSVSEIFSNTGISEVAENNQSSSLSVELSSDESSQYSQDDVAL